MALTKYKNVDDINSRKTGIGEFLEKEDLFVISQNNTEQSGFGLCNNDIMEVTLYDVNNNLLPQKDGKSIKYIKYDKIFDYIIKTNTNELAIDIEKVINDCGYTNGIIKVNLNFVRLKVGDESDFRRVWIQEISPTRTEIRVLPLNVQNDVTTTVQNNIDFDNLQNLNIDANAYRQHLTNVLQLSNQKIQEDISTNIGTKFSPIVGKTSDAYQEFARILSADFGLQYENMQSQTFFDNFEMFISNIVESYKTKLQAKINTLQPDDCNYVNLSESETELLKYIIDSFNQEASKLKDGSVFTFNEIVSDVEQVEEIVFEEGKDIQTASIGKDTQEYSTIDLSDIQLTAENIDNFDAIQKEIQNQLYPSTTEVPITNSNTTPTTIETTDTNTTTPIRIRPVITDTSSDTNITDTNVSGGGSRDTTFIDTSITQKR
jgi:hypothetical protein